MNITELRYLVAIKKWGSVSAAAKQLYAAQPNVSKALKHLEEEYGLRIFERSSTGMIPTEQGRRFIEQAARVLEEVDRLTEDAHHARERCAELRVMIPHATYASYAAVDFLKEAAGADQLRIHIREGGSMEALDFVLRRGYHLALLRYAAEDDDHYTPLLRPPGPEDGAGDGVRVPACSPTGTARWPEHEVKDLAELNHYMEIMHDDFQLPGEDGGDGVRWHVNDSRRIHVYERCSQFSILQQLPSAYMWASPMPQRALDQFHLVLQEVPRPASGHAGRAGLPRPRRTPPRRADLYRPAPPGSRPHGKISPPLSAEKPRKEAKKRVSLALCTKKSRNFRRDVSRIFPGAFQRETPFIFSLICVKIWHIASQTR